MAKTLDTEIILDAIETFLKANFNTEVAAMNTEKGDTVTLSTIDSDAYFYQDVDDRVASYERFIVFGEEENQVVSIGPASRKSVRYTVAIVVASMDANTERFTFKTLYRYRRILVDLFERNWRKVHPQLKFEVQGLRPTDRFKYMNSSVTNRAIGVTLELVYA